MTFAPGGGLPITLGYALAALLAFAAMLLPALGIAWGLGRMRGWNVAMIVGASFAFELFVAGAIALGAHYAGLSLTVVLVACTVVFAALTAVGILLGRDKPRPRLGWQGLVIAALGGVLAVIERPWFAQTSDTFYHLAAVRSLLVTGNPVVTDPFYGSHLNVIDPTSGVWHTLLALVCRATGVDVMWLWPGATAVGAAMTLLAFWVLAERLSRSRWAASIATLGLLAVPLEFDMRWFGYPNRMSLALVFLALAAVVDLMEEPSLADGALLVAAAFGAISLHLASAAVIVLASAFLGLLLLVACTAESARERRVVWRPIATLAGAGAVVAVIALGVLLPKAGIVTTSSIVSYQAAELAADTMRLSAGKWLVARPSLLHDNGWAIAAATLIGLLAAVPAFARKDRRALAVFGLCTLPVALLMDPPLTTFMLHRSLYLTSRIAILLRFPLYVGIAWAFGACWGLRRKWSWSTAAAVAVALTALTFVVSNEFQPLQRLVGPDSTNEYAYSLSRHADIRTTWGPKVLASISAEVGDRYPVIAGDLQTTYYMSGIMPVAVMAAPEKHAPFAVEAIDGVQRRWDTEMLMDWRMPEQVRREILERRRVDYVIVPKDNVELAATLAAFRSERGLFQPLVESDTLVLFKVDRDRSREG